VLADCDAGNCHSPRLLRSLNFPPLPSFCPIQRVLPEGALAFSPVPVRLVRDENAETGGASRVSEPFNSFCFASERVLHVADLHCFASCVAVIDAWASKLPAPGSLTRYDFQGVT